MAYEVLARKWRPQQFDDVVGQRHVTDTLKNAIASGRVAHAYLFVGPRGIGKTSLSRILAKALNCVDGPTATPCGKCDACREIAGGSCLDVIEFDAASHTQVDKVREIILDHVAFAPARCRNKIYIVDEVHMLSAGSFNALLKTLEEPPPHVKFVFATTESHKVPATIVSRCQRFDLRRIGVRDIVALLKRIAEAEKVEISADALLAIARGAEGGMRDAESALDQLIAFRGTKIEEEDVLGVFGLVSRAMLAGLTDAILAGDLSDLIRRVDELDQAGKDMQRLVVELLDAFRNILVMACAPESGTALDILEEEAEACRARAGRTTPDNLLRIVELLAQTESRLRYALSRKTLLEAALIRCARAVASVSIDELLARIQELKVLLAAEGESGGPPPAVETRAPRAPYAVKEPSPRAPASDVAGLAALRARWATVVEEAARRAPAVKAVLLHARPLAATRETVTVGFDPAFAAEVQKMSRTPRFESALRAGLQEVLRRPVTAAYRVADEGTDADGPAAVVPAPAPDPAVALAVAPPADKPDPADDPQAGAVEPADPAAPGEEGDQSGRLSRREVVEHPVVRSALKIFHGQLTEIVQD